MAQRRVFAPTLLLLGALSVGCGSEPSPAPPLERVRLNVTAPSDNAVVGDERIRIAGRVTPANTEVMVLGRRTTVRDGAFESVVALKVGANVIDVLASAGRRRPAMAAIRVTRRATVRVPDLRGVSADEARDRLAALGLRPRIAQNGSILESLLPIDAVVCSTTPGAGAELRGGAEVEVVVAKLC